MNDTLMTEATLQAGLRDIRLPPEAVGGLWSEMAATLALAGLVALLVVAMWRFLGVARWPGRRAGRQPAWQGALADLPVQDEAGRRIALLHLLKTHAPERFAALRPHLYAPTGGPDAATLEQELRQHG